MSEIALDEPHRRHIAASLRHAAELLDEAERILIASRIDSPFRKYTSDLAPWQAAMIGDHITAVRRKLAEAGEELHLDLAGRALDARHAIHVQATFAAIDIEEIRARHVRGYGELDAASARRIDALADALATAIRELEHAISIPPGESIEARLERLSRSPVSPAILETLDRLIAKYHITELRRPMATLVERIEQRTFDIAMFGRVSSGKSSLLNALLGADILPVGVTPITAVPTRVRFGDVPGVRIVYGDGREETVGIEQLAQLASEEWNPGNKRSVALLQVRYPSPLLRDGVEFVDTPGIGALATTGAQETFAYLPRADLAILLVDVGSAIGPDDLSLLRLLQTAAIPLQVVISKADLADAASLERMRGWVRDAIERETGLGPEIHPVSAVPAGAPLLRRWIEESIQPLLARHEEMLDASIRRTAGALRDVLTGRLETLARKRVPPVTTPVDRDARAVVFELRERIRTICRRIEDAADELLAAAAASLFRQEGDVREPRRILTVTVQEFLDEVRADLLDARRETQERLRDLGREAGIPPELLPLAEAPDNLENLPLFDVAAALPEAQVAPPLFAGVAPAMARRHLASRLQEAFGASLRDALRGYARRLGDWASRSLDQLQASFTSALDATRGDCAAGDPDPAALDADLRLLASIAGEQASSASKEHM
ncbi:MAG TPA: dynamin family protein [Thermoanaerobaculia bacterium]|nr:dynamin family protein [Thermoanaerobaculia bacterium]